MQEAVLYVVPIYSLIVLFEWYLGKKQGKDVYANIPDAITGFTGGVGNIIASSIGIGFVLVSYEWMLENFAVFQLDSSNLFVWLVVIVGLDFVGYWKHRIRHVFNFFWQQHLVHHASEEFNLSVAMRQEIVWEVIQFLTFFSLPLAILGIPTEIMATVSVVFVFYQIWYHTQVIGDLGWLERVIVTPQQHAIHHAINPEYIDKNFGAWFSIWDQMFGTFQLKIDGVEPAFGATRPVRTWNPFKIELMHGWQMVKDIFHTQSLKAKFKILVSRTNWRPDDVLDQYPVKSIEDIGNYQKYNPSISYPTYLLCVFEFVTFIGLFLLYFWSFGELSSEEKLYFGLFMFLNIYIFTSLMDGDMLPGLLMTRLLVFFSGVAFLGVDWFHMGQLSENIPPFFVLFYLAGIFISYFCNKPVEEPAFAA